MNVIYLNGAQDKVYMKDNLRDLPRNRLVWVRLLKPTAEEIEAVSKKSKIPVEEFEEFIEDEERSRVDYRGYIQIIYQAPLSERGDVTTEAVSVFVANNMIVTTEREPVMAIDKIIKLMGSNRLKFLFKEGPGKFVYEVLDRINDSFFNSIEKISRVAKISKSEDIDVQQKMLLSLYNSNVTLSHFNQAIIANIEVTNSIRKNRFKQFTNADREEFLELYHDLLQLLDTEKVQREVITSIFNFQTVLSSYKLNNFMKKLTSLALIMLIPTLISSVYGMNVNLPFAKMASGFWIITALMFLLTGSVYFLFKKIDWV